MPKILKMLKLQTKLCLYASLWAQKSYLLKFVFVCYVCNVCYCFRNYIVYVCVETSVHVVRFGLNKCVIVCLNFNDNKQNKTIQPNFVLLLNQYQLKNGF